MVNDKQQFSKQGSNKYPTFTAKLGSTAVQKYRRTVTQDFFSTATGIVDTFKKCTVVGTIVTSQTILLDISATLFE